MTNYADTLPLREAQRLYYADNGFQPDGGKSDRWVKLKLGPIPLAFPNFDARRAVVGFHDLNHLATEYATNLVGEGLIGAFEVGASCGRYLTAWGFNLSVLSWIVFLAPRRALRAFARGRRSRSLYHRRIDDALLDQTVGELRAAMSLGPEPTMPTWRERFAFIKWVGIAWVCSAIQIALLLTPLILLWSLWL